MNKTLHCIIILVGLLWNSLLQAQWQNGLWVGKQANNWYFGVNAGLNFDTSPPTTLSDGQIAPISYINTTPGSTYGNLQPPQTTSASSISDAQGNLLFYTNGHTIWDKNHQIMVNGTDLICNTQVKQSTLIVKAPGNNQRYYVFGVKSMDSHSYLYPESYNLQGYALNTPLIVYTEVDLSLNSGLGAVTENKNVVIASFDESSYGRVTATHHADGNKIWVVFQRNWNEQNMYSAFLVSEDGVAPEYVTTKIGFSENDCPDIHGQIKFSPDGSKFVRSYQHAINQRVELFGFDNATGVFTNIIATLDDNDYVNDGEFVGVQGLEFSPNSRFLYTSGTSTGVIKQIDTQAGSEAAIKASAVNVFVPTEDMPNYSTFMQVAPDGKIYIPYGLLMFEELFYGVNHTTLNVIHYPNNPGTSSGFEAASLDLVTGKSGMSLPTFTQSYFASGILYEGGQCPGEPVTFSTLRIPGIDSIVWNFGDPGSGTDNASTVLQPVHSFSAGGTYTVTALITSNGGQQTVVTEITLPAVIAVVPSSDKLSLCGDALGNATFDLMALNATILGGQDAAVHTVAYYATQADLETGTAIDPPGAFTTAGQTIYAVVTNTTTKCTAITALGLVVHPLPVAGIPVPMAECGDATGTAVFDLTEQAAALLDGQSTDEFTVVYYTDAALTNMITEPGLFASEGQTIHATLISTATGCVATAPFAISVSPQPLLPEIATFEGCSPFDLVGISGAPGAGTAFSFYASEEDAVGTIDAITNPLAYMVSGDTVVYIRAVDEKGCVAIGELFLDQGACEIPRGISPNNDSLNDVFDLSGFGVARLGIFNRYGVEVYSRTHYTNEWSGQATNGDALPTGTYFYVLQLIEGGSKTGWVYLNRQD